jgi:predicted negative regulator of RcsB-dependent stress response
MSTMKDWLQTVPRWFLLGLVLALFPVVSYGFWGHLQHDEKQDETLSILVNTVSNIVVVVEYNRKGHENNTRTLERAQDVQLRVERLLGRLEEHLDTGD